MARNTSLVRAGVLLTLWAVRMAGQEPMRAGSESRDQAVYTDSVAGMQSQMDELIRQLQELKLEMALYADVELTIRMDD